MIFVRWMLSVILGGVFFYAGLAKFLNPENFELSLSTLGWIPDLAVHLIGASLPIFEILCAFGLWIPWTPLQRASNLGLLLMLAAFNVFWLGVLMTGSEMSCSCFGENAPAFMKGGGAWGSLVRNGILLIMGIFLYRLSGKKRGV